MTRKKVAQGSNEISYEGRGGTIRGLVQGSTGDHPAYSWSGELTRITNRVCKLSGFSGHGMSVAHQFLVVALMERLGYEVCYVERAVGHRIALAEQIIGGDFDGWWRMDIARAAAVAKKRSTVTQHQGDVVRIKRHSDHHTTKE